MKKVSTKPSGFEDMTGATESTVGECRVVIDRNSNSISKENWEVCVRMLVHDLLDMKKEIPVIKKLLDYYMIEYYQGGFTMALPRLKVVEQLGFVVSKDIKKKGILRS